MEGRSETKGREEQEKEGKALLTGEEVREFERAQSALR